LDLDFVLFLLLAVKPEETSRIVEANIMEGQGKDKAPAQGENQDQRAAMLESAELAEKHR